MAMARQANSRRLPVSRAPAARLALSAVVASLLLLAAYLAWSGRSEQAAAEERIRSLEATRQRLAWELDEQRQAGTTLAALRQQADTAQADLDRAMADRAEVAQQLFLTQADLQLAQQTLVRITGEVREQQERLTKLEAGIGAGERRAAAAGEAQSAAAQEAEIAARSRELAELGQRLDTARQQEAEARRNLAVITRELEERQTERAWYEALDRAIASRADTVRELLQMQEDQQRAEQTLARTAAQAQEQQARLARIEEEIDRGERRLATLRSEAGALESRIASRSRELAEMDRRLETARQPEAASRPDVAAMAGNGQEGRAALVRFEEPASYSGAEQQQQQRERAQLTSTTVEAQQSEPVALEEAAAKQWRSVAVLPAGFGGAGASAPALSGGLSQREPVEPAAVADRPALRPDEELLFLRRGDQLLKLGDIAGARLFYESAASAGSARAATALGKTHDPLFLQPARARGLRPDPAAAAEWYRRASDAGDGEAADRLKALRAKFPR